MSLEEWRGPVVGVLGGLGPAATVTFLDELVRLTEADRDQDHVDAIVLQHGSVPDRTAAILRDGPSPGPALARDARMLQSLGVDLVALPCNSAHVFIDEIEDGLDIEVLSIVDITAQRAVQAAAGRAVGEAPHTVAVFATEGTIAAGTYERALRRLGASPWLPPGEVQASITTIIYDQVKAGRPADVTMLHELLDTALASGADSVVLGCTELSVVYAREPSLQMRGEVVDSLRSLAVATIERSGRRVRSDLSR